MYLFQRTRDAIRWRLRSLQLWSFAKNLRQQRLRNPFVVIVMPGSLHVARLAIQKMPSAAARLIVLNGLPSWEVRLARELFKNDPLVACGAHMDHDQVLDVLFSNLSTNFGILDYDCFVLEPGYFERMSHLAPGVLMNACFSRLHPDSGLRVPETFFLFFNRDAIQDLKNKYGTNCTPTKWASLNPASMYALQSIGLSADNLPEKHKDYFDTLRVIMMLGVAAGMKLDFLADYPASPTPSGELFHVGGISIPNLVDGIWRFRGIYFWRKALENCPLPELQDRYRRIYGAQSSADLKTAFPEWAQQVTTEFFAFCDRLIASAN